MSMLLDRKCLEGIQDVSERPRGSSPSKQDALIQSKAHKDRLTQLFHAGLSHLKNCKEVNICVRLRVTPSCQDADDEPTDTAGMNTCDCCNSVAC